MTPAEATVWFNDTSTLTKFKSHKPIVDVIIQSTSFLVNGSSMPQRLWHIIHATQTVPCCRMCNTEVNWDRRYKQYKTYCSSKCAHNDPVATARKRQLSADPEWKASQMKKAKLTNQQKYGHTNFLASAAGRSAIHRHYASVPREFNSEQAKTARSTTMVQRYGTANYSTSLLPEGVRAKLDDREWLYNQIVCERKSLTEIAVDLNIKSGCTIVSRAAKHHNIDLPSRPGKSLGETEVSQFLTSINIPHRCNDRVTIAPYELDIYIAEHKLAIEFCGLYWHSEQMGKDRQYHKTKMDMCNARGIRLITMYQDEWSSKQVIVKHKLAHILEMNHDTSVYARNCVVKTISSSDCELFMNTYHIQGYAPASIRIGLVVSDEIVACMTFTQQGNTHTLTRYATRGRVVGGFSKLLHYFKDHHKWSKIISFADLRWGTGQLYRSTGWNLECTIPPDYYYSPDTQTRIHKFNYRRHNLPRLLKTFDPALSEWENCKRNNVFRIWDCGKHRFALYNPTQ